MTKVIHPFLRLDTMKTPAGKECAYFYGDYYRGRNVEECRLLKAQGQAWSRDLCATCPVPSILQANSCPHLKLRTKIARPLAAVFQRRVQVSAYCEKAEQTVAEPQIGCGQCHALPFKFVIKE
ncbi:MAG: hypothetical protein IT311_09630 [Anaerolineales bacterium]|nr:hypothetical protein [Anaerolineales bacterium]MCZ2121588.1 hypothetical protein [Anaerolineales bacterium]